jgi:tetratricopeptide (TPR) repeat protein
VRVKRPAKRPRSTVAPDDRASTTRHESAALQSAVGGGVSQPLSSLDADVRAVNRRFRLGLFDESLFAKAEELLAATNNRSVCNDYVVLKCRCLVAEILELQGRRDLAAASVEEGQDVAQRLEETFDFADPDALRLVRERARFVADFARLHLYRRGKFREAKEYLDVCARVLEQNVRRPTFRCHGTMGLIKYYTGCAERQLGRLDEADRCYVQAIREYQARGQRALENGAALAVLDEELAMARHNTAVILGLGLGWTNSQRGLLTKSLTSNVIPAEILLMGGRDQTHQAYLALIRGSILRSLAGSSNADMLEEAKTSIQTACDAFMRPPYQQQSYALRGWYELALCAIVERDFDAARSWILQTETAAAATGDPRWHATAWMIKSRINRNVGNFNDALLYAEVAIKLTSGLEEALSLIDAYVTRAEALIALGNARAARDDLNRALRIVEEQPKPNQKIESVVHILLANSYLLEGNTHAAQIDFDLWLRYQDNVEHVLVQEMAGGVKRHLEASQQDFMIPWRTSHLDYAAYDRRLRAWLIRRARHEHGDRTRAEVAHFLGIARPTLNAWEVELRDELVLLRVQDSERSKA